MSVSSSIPLVPLPFPPQISSLLTHLHELSSSREAQLGSFFAEDHGLRQSDPAAADARLASLTADQLIALDPDKAAFVYQLIRGMGAKVVVEAGTGWGVSTVYLALAVGDGGKVVATELEEHKIEIARKNWKDCGEMVEGRIDLFEGDVKETLKKCPDGVDLLLLDIWAPLALPVLKLVQPKMRPGAVVITDNTISGAERYKDLLGYIRGEGSGFTNLTLPFTNGLEMSVYSPLTSQ